jgi:membrane protein CcdC involved in cytochrome C biogenesis
MIKRMAYIVLGSIAMAGGALMFGISAYQLITRSELYDRLGAMALFAIVIYQGWRGVKEGLRNSRRDSVD